MECEIVEKTMNPYIAFCIIAIGVVAIWRIYKYYH